MEAGIPRRVEWRTLGERHDELAVVDADRGEVLVACAATRDALADFLNDMTDIPRYPSDGGAGDSNLEARGRLVLARAEEDGQVLMVDPQLYWEGIASWFRSEGIDPHPWRRPT